MRKLITAACLLLSSTWTQADDAAQPDFKSAPVLFAAADWLLDPQGNKHWIVNQAFVGDRANKSLKFWLRTYGPNFHTCSVAGEAAEVSPSVYEFKERSCRLRLNITPGRMSVGDESNACHELYCGQRAYLNGLTLFRVGD